MQKWNGKTTHMKTVIFFSSSQTEIEKLSKKAV